MNNFIDPALLTKIKDECLKQKLSLAIAESVTAGLIQNSFSQAQDAMQFFEGGMTLYNLHQKARHLDLDPILLKRCNCVSQEVSELMALGIAEKFSSELGIGITGFALEVPEVLGSSEHAYVAISRKGKIILSEKILGQKEKGMLGNQVHFALKTVELLSQNI